MPAASQRELFALDTNVNDFHTLFARSSQVPEKLRAGLRKNIRTAAQVAADAAKREVLQPPLHAGSSPRHTGLRQQIADNIKVSVITSAGSPGVVIRSRGFLSRAYDAAKGWRHPVFGDTAIWATTYGRPYFRDVIGTYRGRVTKAVLDAMQDAIAGLAAQGSVGQAAAMQGRLANTRSTLATGGS
jgi:hypothetical protein